jgi:hypothetical protein
MVPLEPGQSVVALAVASADDCVLERYEESDMDGFERDDCTARLRRGISIWWIRNYTLMVLKS